MFRFFCKYIRVHFTGDKKYLMGVQPSEVDCAAFGQLVQMVITPDSIPSKIFMKGMLLSTNVHKKITLREVAPSLH